MFVRAKITKGRTYYQLVTAKRDGEKIGQHIVVALGTTPDAAEALKRTKRNLAQTRLYRNQYPQDYEAMSKMLARQLVRWDVQIALLAQRVEKLTELIQTGALKEQSAKS
jgi:hypothetical protein